MVRGYIYTHYAEMSRENRKNIHKYAENTFDIHNVCNRYGTVYISNLKIVPITQKTNINFIPILLD